MREYKLTCDKFEYISILDVKARKAAGEHASFTVKGHIAVETDEYVLHSMAEQGVEFTAESPDGDKKIFSGIVSSVNVSNENEMRILTVTAISRSAFMDIEPETRTFQDSGMTYGMVTSRMEETSGTGNFLWPVHGDTPIGSMTVQYMETDWQYALRLAGRLGTVVIPDYLLDEPYVSIGMTKKVTKGEMQVLSYSVEKDVERFRKTRDENFAERDAVSYKIKSREILDLCDNVYFKELSLYVYAIDTTYEGEQLVHYYTLKEESGFHTERTYNENLSGIALSGSVAEVQNDKVRINVHGDVIQTNHKWFSYATPFSQPDGQGWYFMPELGDEVRLVFPNRHEDEAYVSSAVHVTHGNRTNPEIKFIRTIYGQVIQFDPEKILIDDGVSSKVTLQREHGISMTTSRTVNMTAQSDIILSASGKVEISGADGVILQKGDTVVSVDDAIDLLSQHTREQ